MGKMRLPDAPGNFERAPGNRLLVYLVVYLASFNAVFRLLVEICVDVHAPVCGHGAVPGYSQREVCDESGRPEDSRPGASNHSLRFRQVWISGPVVHTLGDEDAEHVNEDDGGYVYSESHVTSVPG